MNDVADVRVRCSILAVQPLQLAVLAVPAFAEHKLSTATGHSHFSFEDTMCTTAWRAIHSAHCAISSKLQPLSVLAASY